MKLSELDINENRIKLLEKKGFSSVKDVQEFFPRKYYDFRKVMALAPENAGGYCSIVGTCQQVETQKTNNVLMLKAKVYDEITDKKLNIIWIGSYYLYKIIRDWEGERVIAAGKLTYNEEYHSFHMNNPIIFSKSVERNLVIYPVYRKMTGISDEYMQTLLGKALAVDNDETIPEELMQKHSLMSRIDALKSLHRPADFESVRKARARFVYEDLLQFAYETEMINRQKSKGTIYNIRTLRNTTDYINHLPFQLSESQDSVIKDMQAQAKEGRRINALVQGDVGSGKTVVAFAMMLSMADSGYQSILMAPTVILARQHYESLSESAEKYGYKTAFLSGEIKASERKKLLRDIAEGEYDFIVGTHGVMNVQYHNLAMVIVDEEHKFGVMQRKLISEQASKGVHSISLSATPIPRTLAETIYGTNISVYDLKVPEGRKTVQTAIFNNSEKICEFVLKKIHQGQQVYVVSPYIDDPEEQYDIETVENALNVYTTAFASVQDVHIGVVTGKMKQTEADSVISDFVAGKYQILIATTIIEVGVNVPNANIIIINNAERFGLAQLHQLRGRVGRGKEQGYCILKSSDSQNPRLQTMCRTTNGYEIAMEDMKLRGTGDLLGTDQSGRNKYIELITSNTKIYHAAVEDAKIMADNGWSLKES